MNIIYYTDKAGEIDSFHRGPDNLLDAYVQAKEFNEKWTIQRAHVLHIEEDSFVDFLYQWAMFGLSARNRENKAYKAMEQAQRILDEMEY